LEKMKQRIIPTFVLAAVVGATAGCGGSSKAGVFEVKKGMTQAQVIAAAGHPYLRGGPAGRACWDYRASKKGTSIDGMRFCFTNGRVSLVQTAVHA
jgi:hypothetical protein